jgi:hypothetical protein
MEPKYLLVENPLTGKHVNILPLFQYFQDEYSGESTTVIQATEPFQDALDYLAVSLPTTNVEADELGRRNFVNGRLISLRDTFRDMFKPL